MQDKEKTREQLISELTELRQRCEGSGSSQPDLAHAEQELKKTKDFLDNIIESSLDCIIITDRSGYITRANEALLKLMDCKKEDLTGLHMAEISITEAGTYESASGEEVQIKKNPGDAISEIMFRLHTEGKIKNLENFLVRMDKKVVPVEENIVSLRDEQGNTIGAVGILRDITERKRVEKELRETKNFLENVIESSRDGIIIVNEQGYITSVNPAMENMCSFNKEALTGQHASTLTIDDENIKKNVLESMDELFTRGYCSYETKHITRAGQFIDVECNTSIIKDERGNIAAGVSIIRDVTDRKRMERQLQQAQKMEAVGTLAGGIAHDFNNILAAIIGYTEINILQGFADKIKARRNSEQVLKSAERAKELINQILTFSRQNENEKKYVQVSSAINETLKLLRATLPTTIEIQTVIETDAKVMADQIQMQQLLMNLCTNAAHAMREKGGILGIELSEVNLDAETASKYHDLSPGPFLMLTFRDTGTGIDPAVIDRVFEPFFTTKGVGEGTGMGIALAYGIVKNHGGDITVDSRPGRGTTFQILLPRAVEKTKEKAEISDSIHSGTERILFVDDEELLVDVGQKLLESLGYNVVATSSSNDALDIFRKEPESFDLVITDQTMPVISGYALATKLMEIRPDVPVILCTGFSETVSPEQAKAAGIREFVIKPVNRATIAEIIRRVLDKK